MIIIQLDIHVKNKIIKKVSNISLDKSYTP